MFQSIHAQTRPICQTSSICTFCHTARVYEGRQTTIESRLKKPVEPRTSPQKEKFFSGYQNFNGENSFQVPNFPASLTLEAIVLELADIQAIVTLELFLEIVVLNQYDA